MTESAGFFRHDDEGDKRLPGAPDDPVRHDDEKETSKVIGGFDGSKSSSRVANGETADSQEDEINEGGPLCI